MDVNKNDFSSPFFCTRNKGSILVLQTDPQIGLQYDAYITADTVWLVKHGWSALCCVLARFDTGPFCLYTIMTSSNGNIFRVTDLLCGEITGPG